MLLNSKNNKFENNVAEINKKLTSSTFGELRVANRTNLIDIKSVYGISNLRDLTTITGSATITNTLGVNSEYSLKTTANGTDKVILESRQRGRYIAGIEGETGIAIRLSKTNFQGNQIARWGYFDDNNGYGFCYDVNGLCIFIRKSGVDTYINNFFNNNNNILSDGYNKSLYNPLKGNIYNISITWYGYGNIIFIINTENIPYKIYHYNIPENIGTSCDNPNLPIRVELDNDGTAISNEIFVAGRQYSLIGSYNPSYRITPMYRLGVSIPTTNAGSTDNFTPILTLRRESNFPVADILFTGFNVITNNSVIVSVFLDTTLDGNEVFGDIPNINNNESALQIDTTASDFTGSGIVINTFLVAGASGNNTILSNNEDLLKLDLSGNENITIAAKALSTTSTIDIVVKMREEW